jgi:hypothetical protein
MKIRPSQKVSLVFIVGVCLIILLAHNPMSGYIKKNTENITITKQLVRCSEHDKEAYKKTLTDIYESDIGKDMKNYADAHLGGYKLAIEEKLKDCHIGDAGMLTDVSTEKIKQSKTVELGFRDWNSTSPKIKWLSNTMHAIYACLGTIVIGAIFLIFI